jgi:sterol O-acyltransferase
VPFAKAVSRGWIKYYSTGVILQHLLQASILFSAIKWTFNRLVFSLSVLCDYLTSMGSQWPWVQSGFLTLHSLVRGSTSITLPTCNLLKFVHLIQTMLMKMHSYMATNGYLRYVSQQSAEIQAQLRDATLRVGGWEKAIADAKRRLDDLERETDTDSTGTMPSPSPSGNLRLPNGDLSTPYLEVASASALRNRLIHVTETETTSETVLDDGKRKNATSHILTHHPDPRISALATEFSDLESELVSSGPERVRWPENITLKNFAVYQLIPTLVYELEYPRTKRYSRPWSPQEDCHGLIITISRTESVRCTSSKRQSQRSALSLSFILPRRRSFCRIRIPTGPSLGHYWTWPYRSCWHTFYYSTLYSVRPVVIQICSVPCPNEVLRMYMQRIR